MTSTNGRPENKQLTAEIEAEKRRGSGKLGSDPRFASISDKAILDAVRSGEAIVLPTIMPFWSIVSVSACMFGIWFVDVGCRVLKRLSGSKDDATPHQ